MGVYEARTHRGVSKGAPDAGPRTLFYYERDLVIPGLLRDGPSLALCEKDLF